MSKSALPDHLKDRAHEDYIWPFSLIPRAWTSYKLGGSPTLVAGNQKNFVDFGENLHFPDPIPDPLLTGGFAWGIYGVALGYWLPRLPLAFACSFKIGTKRLHIRFPLRWDSVDFYWTIPSFEISTKKKY